MMMMMGGGGGDDDDNNNNNNNNNSHQFTPRSSNGCFLSGLLTKILHPP